MNRYGFKRLLALLLACIMMMGCCAFATEETDAAAQELLHEEEQSLSAAAEESDGAVNQEKFTNENTAANEEAEPDDDATASDDIVEYRSGEDYSTCAHAHTYSYQGIWDVVYTPVDDKYHEVSGYVVTVVYCTDCLLILSEDAEDERSSRQEKHDFSDDDGSCYYCGAENTCPHSNTYTNYYWQDVEYTPIDEKTHERRGHRETNIWCEDCDVLLSKEVSAEITSEIERHWFEDGVCDQCGAENTCAHNNTYIGEYWLDVEYTPIDEKTHERRGHRVTRIWCEDCEMTLSEEVSPEISSEIERHWFEDGACEVCGYVNTCSHAHTTVEKYPSDEGEYTAIDGWQHQWRGHLTIELRCLDCEETLSSEQGEELVSQIWDHEFQDGVCYQCGYVNTCTHRYTYVDTFLDLGTGIMTPVDEYVHEFSGYPMYSEHCMDCGEELKRWTGTENVTRLEDHYFEAGVCGGCGYSINCAHKRVDRWTGFEGSTYEDVGNDRYHISHGTLYKYEICLDCDKILSRETSDFTKKESHVYVNGRCVNCGHVKACDHSRTVESEWEKPCEYKDVSATSHTYRVILEKHLECAICGQDLGRTGEVKETVITEKHYFYDNAVCICGRRNTCKHNGKINEYVYWQDDTVYTPVDGTYHMAEGTQIKDYTCDQCDRLMKSEDLGHVKKKVEHNFSKYRGYCWSCYADGSAEAPKSVSIVQQNQKLNLGETLQLTAEISPAGASTSLSWTSSDAKIATVDENGLVTPVKEGSVTITVKTANGKSGTTKITVVDPYKLTGVKLDKTGTVSLNLGETLTLIPCPVPETALSTYSWKTSSAKIATVVDGVVTPVGEGTATITVTATRGSVKKTATVKVKVVDPYKPTGVKLDKTGTVSLNLGETLTLTPSLSPETAQATYSWKTSSAKIATVVDGVVTPVGEGTATITVTAMRGKIKKTATVKVKVVDPYKPTGVKLDKTGTVNLNLGETLTLTPSLAPETAQASYTWKTSSAKIATVADGVVTPVGEGTATITVTATRGKIKKTATVKVKVVDPYKPTAIKLDKTGTVNLNLGESLTLTPSLAPETAQATYSWKSSSTKIATVSDGVVTPVGEGTATITVTATRGKIKKTASVKVKVVEPYVVDALSFIHTDSPGDLKILVGELSYISVGVKPVSASKTANLSFSLSNDNVYLSRKSTGEIRVQGVKPGTTTITVKDVNTGVKATMKVVVRNRKA